MSITEQQIADQITDSTRIMFVGENTACAITGMSASDKWANQNHMVLQGNRLHVTGCGWSTSGAATSRELTPEEIDGIFLKGTDRQGMTGEAVAEAWLGRVQYNTDPTIIVCPTPIPLTMTEGINEFIAPFFPASE